MGMEQRVCSICGNEFPLDSSHFKKKRSSSGTILSAACRACLLKQKRDRHEITRQKRDEAMRQIEEAGVDLYLRTATRGGSSIPHSAEVIERVMEYFGGVAGFSAVVVKQFWDSPPGGSARNRLIETMCRLVSKNVEQGGAKKPLALWSEEELERELDSRFKEALSAYSGVTIDVRPQAITQAPQGQSATDPNRPVAHAVSEGLDQGSAVGTAVPEG